MKSFFLMFVPLILSISAFGQKYSKAIKDTSIMNFMTWLLDSDTTFKAVREVNIHMLRWSIHNSRDMVTVDTAFDNYHHKYIIDSNLIKYLDEKDADYFIFQVKRQRKLKWKLRLKNIQLIDEEAINPTESTINPVIFAYSLSLFAKDEKYAVIIERFWCGLVCGGGSYNLYERQASNTCKKIKEFNQWAE